MALIHTLTIRNFRGIKDFTHTFGKAKFVCLIGRGDSGKSTILEAISYVLSANWIIHFHDTDFHNCNVEDDILIEATLTEVPEKLLTIEKYGLFIRGINSSGQLCDELQGDHEKALTVALRIGKDLEPSWTVTNGRDEKSISANDRSKLDAFMLSDYSDRHFSWNKGGPLYSLSKRLANDDDESDDTVVKAFRVAKVEIDKAVFPQFDKASLAVKNKAQEYGVDISNLKTTIDFKDMPFRDGKVSLHGSNIPFRLKGKGSKRLISAAIQASLAENQGIVLIDEFEQGLEPDRIQHLASSLKNSNKGQIFITTHSRDVIVQLTHDDIHLMAANCTKLLTFDNSMQGCLRKHPEAFFAKKVLVCEGPTEMGMCRALNRFRIGAGNQNMAFLGVCLVDGGGTRALEYSKGFASCDFNTMLFCDSDDSNFNKEKQELKEKGISVNDWEDGLCLEEAVFIHSTHELARDIYRLAIRIRVDEQNETFQEAASAMWASVASHYGTGCPADFSSDSPRLRKAIGSAASKKKWFKSHTKGEAMGTLIFRNFASLGDAELASNLNAISNWIER